ncbi:DNA damage-inducible transcript 4-like protein [Penaeus japonicus]|uniref:DNA damage-inducible transcript 4-like protein n=1 Tax=Penaeus japonicus TaxID=27405 RepID=UPI001C717316|nr:DNA damage-inducible transcript 4-like protein [Penaeus japonicus]
MLRTLRPQTYEAQMPRLVSDFYDYNAEEDEFAASLLAAHFCGLVHRARKNKLAQLTKESQNAASTAQDPAVTAWLTKLIPSMKTQVPVYLPRNFVARVVRDVMRMSEGEIYGIRGCTLFLDVLSGNKSVCLGKIVCDPNTPTTCTIHILMTRVDPPTDNVGFNLFGIKLLNTQKDAVYISPGYTVEKKRPKSLMR